MKSRSFVVSLAFASLLSFPAVAQTFGYDGLLTFRGVNASGPASWLERGPGVLEATGNRGLATARIGGDWFPAAHFDAHAQLLGRIEPHGYGGSRAGVVEAWAEATGGGWQLRAGQFFLPTSRENIDPLWTSPYALSLSSVNDWIAQEVRPVGADLQWKGSLLTLGATAFHGNDTSGTLLGWRGWTVGDRLSVTGETLPLVVPAAFTAQRDGSVAFGRDLDGHVGVSARARLTFPDRAIVQLTHFDNRGDRRLYGDQYSWQTRFDLLGIDAGSRDGFHVAAEILRGRTGMGFSPGAFVQADVYAGYLLLSQRVARCRITGRLDVFETLDRDLSIGGNTTEHGRAWALDWLYDLTPTVRAGAEFVQATGRRDVQLDGRSVTLELRYSLH